MSESPYIRRYVAGEEFILRKVTATSLVLGNTSFTDPEVIRAEYVPDDLIVTVRSLTSGLDVSLGFSSVIGFRVLDERDLLEYWPECSTPNGWVFEIASGGWLSSESKRPGCLIATMSPEAREYFVAGCNSCVSVICLEVPVLREVSPE
jgi:hypothetical protein